MNIARGANSLAVFISNGVPSKVSPLKNLLRWTNASRSKMIVTVSACRNSTLSRLTRKLQFVD